VIPDLMKYGLDPAPLYDLHLITFADLDLKTACFYMDWDPKNESWKYDISVDWNNLKKGITSFKKKLVKFAQKS
jgi:hypothetical protein